MPTTVEPYIEQHPHDLITAENWNEMQRKIRQDIQDQITKALDALQNVPNAGNSSKLGGKTIEELAKEIVDSTVQKLNRRSGYMRVFRMLKAGQEALIKHELKDYPEVDIYKLEPFEAACSEDGEVLKATNILFY